MIQMRRVCAVLAATIVLTLAPAFAKTIELGSATIADINAAFDAGTLTAEKLVQMCLARIAAFDRKGPALHAVITLNPKALEVARALGGQALNPPDLTRSPSGSSGGTGVAIAAAYAPLGMGTDTGGSIRGPSTSNGIVGLKPTHGLLSRSGIIPLALSFDTGGPMARSVSDVAVALGIMTGVDAADAATKKSEGRLQTDYTKELRADALKGARIGVARDLPRADGAHPNPSRWSLFKRELESGTLTDYRYTAVHDYGLPMVRAIVEGMFEAQQLDAIVYPTASRRPALIAAPPAAGGTSATAALGSDGRAAADRATPTGLPDPLAPAGSTR